MFGIGPLELVLILVVALLVLGPKRMPELARTLGKGLGEFRRASHDLRQSLALDEIQNELRDGLTGAGTIHKPVKTPQAEDKPAQAGDELAPGEADAAASETESQTGKHPGELPDDLDPHAHHDTRLDDASAPAESAGDGDAPAAEPSASDADLGAVPVGRTVTPRRTQEPQAPAEGDGTGDERG